MNEGFISFKKKILKRHLIISLILFISLFLIIFGIFYLLTKLKVISINIGIDILISILISALITIAYYFILKPSDKKIAKTLDEKLELKEKVQTMVELKDEDSFIATLQREDCESKLKGIPLTNLKFKLPIILIILSAIGITSTVTAACVPSKVEHKEDENKEEIDKNTTLKKLEELRAQVLKYEIDSTLKNNYVNEIDSIIEAVKKETPSNELKTLVYNSINNVLVLDKNYSQNKKIGSALNNIIDVKYEASNTASNPYIGTFKTFTEPNYKIVITSTSIEINSVAYAIKTDKIDENTKSITASLPEDESNTVTVSLIYGEAGNKTNNISYNDTTYYLCEDFMYYKALGRAIYNYDSNIANYFSYLSQDYESTYSSWVAYTKKRIALESNALKKVLETSGLDKNDDYYTGLNTYISVLDSCSSISSSKLTSTLQDAIIKLEETYNKKFEAELNAYNCADLIDTTLRLIFGLEVKSTDTDKLVNKEDDTKINKDNNTSSDDTDKDQGAGGYGKGDPQYASDDKFFALNENGEPEILENKQLYVYSHFYAEYIALYTNLIEDGTLTNEEIVDYLNDYFSKLVNGVNNK